MRFRDPKNKPHKPKYKFRLFPEWCRDCQDWIWLGTMKREWIKEDKYTAAAFKWYCLECRPRLPRAEVVT